MSLRIVFAGTPEFACPSLEALMKHHTVCAVYTKPDSPSGRGLKLQPSAVKKLCIERYPQVPILQPVNLKDADTQRQLSGFRADVMIVIAYGLILPKEIFPFFKYGCINIHASLLPRWRGAAPIQRALLAGDEVTGVTIMQIDEGLDTGAMLHKENYHIAPQDSAQTIHDNLAELGAKSLLTTLEELSRQHITPIAQDNTLATYAAKITKEEARINWHDCAQRIDRHIRAFNPWPVAFTYLNGNLFKIWEAEIANTSLSEEVAGKVIGIDHHGIEVATQRGSIYLKKIQLPGGKPISVNDFLNARGDQIKLHITILGEPC
jgi:methionyl-tRNA formyltransferase